MRCSLPSPLELAELRLPLAVRALMERMAAGVLSAAPPDPAAFERYWGNPFFAQERIRALIETGALARDANGQWQVTRPIESIEMPDTIHGVIMSRIDRLPEATRRALQVASVAGRTFDLGLLAAVCDMPGETARSLWRHLRDLRDLGIAPAETDAPDESPTRAGDGDVPSAHYVFRNITTQEVAYASLPYERRRVLHRHIGDFLEGRMAGEGGWRYEEPSGLLTYHYYEGQVWDKALSLCPGRRSERAAEIRQRRCRRRVSACSARGRNLGASTHVGGAGGARSVGRRPVHRGRVRRRPASLSVRPVTRRK